MTARRTERSRGWDGISAHVPHGNTGKRRQESAGSSRVPSVVRVELVKPVGRRQQHRTAPGDGREPRRAGSGRRGRLKKIRERVSSGFGFNLHICLWKSDWVHMEQGSVPNALLSAQVKIKKSAFL